MSCRLLLEDDPSVGKLAIVNMLLEGSIVHNNIEGAQSQTVFHTSSQKMPDQLYCIFITGYGDVPMTVQAMKAGAVEFLTKPLGDEVLLSAIRGAIKRSCTALDNEANLRILRDRYASLSRRKREVMALVLSGSMNKQAAFNLGISEITVKAHRGRVMRKMKAHSLAALVTMAAKLRPAPVSAG